MEASRRVSRGEASAIFGKDALPLDKFTRTVGYVRLAEQTYKIMDEQSKAELHAYADGINSFIDNVDFTDPDASARLLPPEFYVFGLTGDKLKRWHPIDTIGLNRMIGMHLTWSFGQDFTREVVRQTHPDLAELFDELIPY